MICMFSSTASALSWLIFIVVICGVIALDLGVFHRRVHRVSTKEALLWTILWIGLSLLFNAYIWWSQGSEKGLEFLNAYLIEKALSVDNIFVFIVLFRYMRVPPELLHRVLFAGVLGALIMRGVFIFAGLALIQLFDWTLYFFGAFLLFTGIRLVLVKEKESSGEDEVKQDNWIKSKAEKWLRITREFAGPKFFIRRHGLLYATPLFTTLLMIETADVVFALDSIPAIFGISKDPFIVFTSNVCAILGLRSMFFLLESVIDRFRYLNTGLGLILSFVGIKMILELGFGTWIPSYHIPVQWSLGIIGGLLFVSMMASLVIPEPSNTTDDSNS